MTHIVRNFTFNCVFWFGGSGRTRFITFISVITYDTSSCINLAVLQNQAVYVCVFQYAAAAAALAGPGSSPLLLCHPQYSLALAALHQDRLHTKNSSIADLRLKAKKHAEALELGREKESV